MKVSALIIFLLINVCANSSSTAAPTIRSTNGSEQNHTGSMEFLGQTALDGLPLKIMEPTVTSALPMVIYISGDGGLNAFSQSFCTYLTQKGVPVVVLDAQKYFWKIKTPEDASADLATIVEAYEKIWNRKRFVLIGFSFGASIVPFIATSFPEAIASKLSASILINPDKRCDFEIHVSDMLNLGIAKGNYDVIKEISKCDRRKISVYFGSDESRDVREAFQQTGIKVQIVQGNHHFDNGYEVLADLVFADIANNMKLE